MWVELSDRTLPHEPGAYQHSSKPWDGTWKVGLLLSFSLSISNASQMLIPVLPHCCCTRNVCCIVARGEYAYSGNGHNRAICPRCCCYKVKPNKRNKNLSMIVASLNSALQSVLRSTYQIGSDFITTNVNVAAFRTFF